MDNDDASFAGPFRVSIEGYIVNRETGDVGSAKFDFGFGKFVTPHDLYNAMIKIEADVKKNAPGYVFMSDQEFWDYLCMTKAHERLAFPVVAFEHWKFERDYD